MIFTHFTPAPFPADFKFGYPKMCIRNAMNTAMDHDLEYAEGITKSVNGIWYRHAWNIDANGKAVDPTWRTPGVNYLGRIIPLREKADFIRDRGIWEFSRPEPDVPEGEFGMDCLTASQRAMLDALREG